MPTIKRIAIYLITFIVLLFIVGVLTNFWKSLDYYVYRTFYLDKGDNVNLRKDIALIDLPYFAEGSSTYDRGNYRKRLADLLDNIGTNYDNDNRPKAVLLDIFIRNDVQELETLKISLKKLKEKGVKVYGVYDMRPYQSTVFEKHDAKQAQELYESYLEGYRLHTLFDERMGVLSYESELKFPREFGGHEFVEALASKVARDINEVENPPSPTRGYILPIGNESDVNDKTYAFTHASGSTSGGKFSTDLSMKNKILVVGSLAQDQIAIIDKTGTHLVAWALNDQLQGNKLAKQPLNNPALIIGMILFFSLFVVLVFALLFKYVKSLQTKPVVLSVLSFILGVVVLILFGFAILSLGKVMPVGLTIIGMLLAAFLSWRYAYKFLVTGVAEGAQKYDVFISYSHGNSDWVIKNVYEPLAALRKPDGDKLKIFFDRNSIGVGEAFTSKYMWGIVDSKYFIPIISEEYYGKNHCKNEMDLAYKRSVEKLINILPIAFSYDAVPQIYTHINFSDITVNPNFMEGIKAELLKTDATEN